MKKIPTKHVLAWLTALTLALPSGRAQAVSASDTESSSGNPDIVVLDPFTVTAETEGYKAIDTSPAGAFARTSRTPRRRCL